MTGSHPAHGGRKESKASSFRHFQGSESRRSTDRLPHSELLERVETVCNSNRQKLLESEGVKFKTAASGKRDVRTTCCGGQLGSIHDK